MVEDLVILPNGFLLGNLDGSLCDEEVVVFKGSVLFTRDFIDYKELELESLSIPRNYVLGIGQLTAAASKFCSSLLRN